MPGALGARDTRDKAGLKCQDLTYDVSPQCRVFAGRGGRGGGNFPPNKAAAKRICLKGP